MISRRRLERFIEQIPFEALTSDISGDTTPPEAARRMLRTYINEMHVAFDLVQPLIEPGQRILEVGAGLCLFSLFLKDEGYDVVALEPAAGGFDGFDTSKRRILERYASLQLPILEQKAQTLDPAQGRFDLIFSNNVVEHIPDVEETFTALAACLEPGGVMVHGCPNYVIPYEPHLGIVVLPFLPGLSERFFPGLMYRAFRRLDEDEEFRRRQRHTLPGRLYPMLKYSGGLGLLRRLPPALATPMVCELRLGSLSDAAPR